MIRDWNALALAWLSATLCLNCLAADTGGESGSPKEAKSYQIRNQKYGNLLRPKDANNATGTPLVLYPAQPWKCMTWKLHSLGEGRFQLQNHFTSKTFAAETAGEKPEAAVRQVPFDKDAAARPTWEFTKLPDGKYKILDVKSGQALTAVPAANGGSTISIALQPWHGGDEQKWQLEEIDPRQLTM